MKSVPPVSDPDGVVKAIVECARRPQREVIVGRVGRAVALGQATFPGVYDSLVHPVFDKFAFGTQSVENTTETSSSRYPPGTRFTGSGEAGAGSPSGRLATAAVVAAALALVRARTRDGGLPVLD